MTNLKYISIKVKLGTPLKEQTIDFVSSGFTLFLNAQHLLIKLQPNERAFFDYLCERMNKVDNSININTVMKENFIEHISKITSNKCNPSIKSVTAYLKKLVSIGLLILNGNKLSELYSVNPKYVFKGTAKQRTDTLTTLIESRNKSGLPNNMLINATAK